MWHFGRKFIFEIVEKISLSNISYISFIPGKFVTSIFSKWIVGVKYSCAQPFTMQWRHYGSTGYGVSILEKNISSCVTLLWDRKSCAIQIHVVNIWIMRILSLILYFFQPTIGYTWSSSLNHSQMGVFSSVITLPHPYTETCKGQIEP